VIMSPEQQIDPTFSACSRSSNGQILRKTHMGQPNDNVAALVNSKMTSYSTSNFHGRLNLAWRKVLAV
jgi:hypothetical protein